MVVLDCPALRGEVSARARETQQSLRPYSISPWTPRARSLEAAVHGTIRFTGRG